MIKVVAVFILIVAVGGVLFLILSPFSSAVTSAIPSLGGVVTNITSQIQPVITYVQENALQVGAITTAVGGFCTMVWSKVYKHNVEKKEIETTAKMNEVTGQYFTLDNEKRTLENQLAQAQDKITTLEDGASTVQELKLKLDAKQKEIDCLSAEKNQLERLIPNIQSVEQMKEELKKVP